MYHVLPSVHNGKIFEVLTRPAPCRDNLGRWQIEPSELHRVYPPHSSQVDDSEHHLAPNQTAEIERLKATVEGLERLCRQIEGDRDSLRDQNINRHPRRFYRFPLFF
jgi:hypothetical protein